MSLPAANSQQHEYWMRRCLELARRGAGAVSPNPLVGSAVVSAEGEVLGEGWHQLYGGPHAEHHAIYNAIRDHGPEVLKRATLYVNLEPCSHFGKTPPCADLILEKGITRVVIGMVDPHPVVQGSGIQRLLASGVDVCMGVLEADCKRLNEAFMHHIKTGRPLVTLKVAQTLDGRVATSSGDARWISGEAARTRVHQWRAELDAVLVGSGTARADDPALTVRRVTGRQPYRIVLDRSGSLPASLRLFSDAYAGQTYAAVSREAHPAYEAALAAAGGGIVRLPLARGRLDLNALLTELGRKDSGTPPLQSLLVEAGPGLATALLAQDLVDRYYLFVAPKIVGEGIPAVQDLSVDRLKDAYVFPESRWEQVGGDMLFQGYRRLL